MDFFEANSAEDYKIASELFQEYAKQIQVDLEFQNFKEEIADLAAQYAPPQGILYVVKNEKNSPIGCFAIRALEEQICELKRMYLKKEGRGKGIGKKMLYHSINAGRQLGYKKMRLDTLPTMHTAIALYKQNGFYEITPYRHNPIKGTKFLEIIL